MKNSEYIVIYYNLLVSTIVLLFITNFGFQETYELMLVYAINSTIVFGLLIYYEMICFKGLSLNLLVLIGCIMRFVFPSITKAWGAINGEVYEYIVPYNIVNDYMFPTVVWMNIYYSIFYWCFLRFSCDITIENAIKPIIVKYNVIKFTIPLFFIGITYNIMSSSLPANFIPSFVSTFLGQLSRLAIIAQLFVSIFKPTRINKTFLLIFIIVSIWQTMFWGFYKGAIIINFVYYLLYYFLDGKYNGRKTLTLKFVLGIVAIFFTIDSIIYPFMTTKRVESGWDATTGLTSQNFSNMQILGDVISGNSVAEVDDNTAAERLDAIGPNAFFYKECNTKGLRTTKILVNNLELLVPKFLNQDKHISQAGLMVTSYVTTGSFNNFNTARSYTFIGQFASAYLIGGWLMAIILAFFNGWLIMVYYNYLLKNINNILAVILLIPCLMSALTAFEEIHDGGFLRAGTSIIMMIVIMLMTKFLPNFLTIKQY